MTSGFFSIISLPIERKKAGSRFTELVLPALNSA
jgi:hypothetical protein